jgi:hypothetical protein
VDLSGRILLIGGSCPNVAFWVEGRLVFTSQGTDYTKGRCSDLSNGDTVNVSGTVRPAGGVDASRVEIKQHEND